MKRATIITCLFGWCHAQAAFNHRTCSHRTGPSLIPADCPLPINHTAAKTEADWAPWSKQPVCFQPVHKPNTTDPYCLYTHPTFRNHGISVITTPGLAAALTSSLDDGIVPRHQRDHPSSPMSAQQRSSGALAYEIRDLPGRGKGLVATRPIRRWETVVVQFPSLVVLMDFWEAVESPKQSRRLLNRALKQLPAEEKGRILALARTGGFESQVEDVLRTNIFGVDVGGAFHMGLFVEGSRVNHNCRPNVYWKYDTKTMAQEVVALRDIEQGEELTHSYVTLGGSRSQRREELEAWGFECKCSLCSASPQEVGLSDRRREMLNDLGIRLREAKDLSPEEVAVLVDQMGALIELEQLHPQVVVYYTLAARAFLAVGDRARARDFVRLAEEAWVRFQGEEHENVEGIEELWRQVGGKE
ncbi:hypothetical protein MCOR03_000122 [Pyricularia oryzae]|nr:hypothetical protein MCOR26_004863 [Pyricularia oryzae]KAI6311414.1 hypothetical protein MCOR34_006034 [Pyricularia oryzae]KAI6349748.1 hypothetical protein MCOR28_000809 [Pyricularia oryzae]KAI6359950.1 hypothetical protein MCOR31_009286 [Pyricularia oryzae]KAI6387376.1 hypothetical protein MCOR32_000524 [Pyricularia oryzae]